MPRRRPRVSAAEVKGGGSLHNLQLCKADPGSAGPEAEAGGGSRAAFDNGPLSVTEPEAYGLGQGWPGPARALPSGADSPVPGGPPQAGRRACRPPTEACPHCHGAHPHAEGVTARPIYHQAGLLDEAWPGWAGESGSSARIADRGSGPRAAPQPGFWSSFPREAPRRAWGRTGGTAPGDDQAGTRTAAGSPPPTSGP